MNEIKKSKLAIYLGVILTLVLGVVNIFRMRFLIQGLGSDGEVANGIYQFFLQVLMYFSIFETGLRTAGISSLFEPLVQQNVKQIQSLVKGLRKYYTVMSSVIIIVGILLIPFYASVIHRSLLLTAVITILFIARLALPFYAYDVFVLIGADNKNYYSTIATSVASTASSLIALAVLVITRQFMWMLAVENVIYIVVLIGFLLHYRKLYKVYYRNDVTPSYHFKEEMRGAVILRLTDTIMNNTDIIVIVSVLGTTVGSSFATYNATSTILFLIVSVVITEAIRSLLGRVYSEHKKGPQFILLVHRIKILNYVLIGVVVPMLFIFLKPFTEFFFNPTFHQTQLFLIVYCAYFHLRMLRTPYHALKTATNRYNEFVRITLINSFLNLAMSIGFTILFGTIGVLLGSFIALLITEFWFDIYKIEVKDQLFSNYRIFGELGINIMLTWMIALFGVKYIQPRIVNLVDVFIYVVPTLIFVMGINMMVYYHFDRNLFSLRRLKKFD